MLQHKRSSVDMWQHIFAVCLCMYVCIVYFNSNRWGKVAAPLKCLYMLPTQWCRTIIVFDHYCHCLAGLKSGPSVSMIKEQRNAAKDVNWGCRVWLKWLKDAWLHYLCGTSLRIYTRQLTRTVDIIAKYQQKNIIQLTH